MIVGQGLPHRDDASEVTTYGLAVDISVVRFTTTDHLKVDFDGLIKLRRSVTSVPIWLLAREEREMFFRLRRRCVCGIHTSL